MRRQYLLAAFVMSGAALLLAAGWRVAAQGGPPPRTSLVLGQPLPGLTNQQRETFAAGLLAFSETETPEDGIGPVFNGVSCAECHKAGAIGGAGTDLTTAAVIRIGGIRNGRYSDLEEVGGPVLQARSLQEFNAACPIPGEVIPREARFVSRRITTPLFGLGLIEAIPADVILARAGRKDADGVRGMANFVFNPETGQQELGRFGWKAQVSTLRVFAADAYVNEMGITLPLFPEEKLPQGRPIPAGWDIVGDPEDDGEDAVLFAEYMRLLAPAGRRLPLPRQALDGERVFADLRCTSCHVPEMRTGAHEVAALAYKPVRLYSDLLLHRMGRGLADGIQQGQAEGDQFRTAPLWGLSRRSFYLHDGRATSIEAAILNHDGEASASRKRYLDLGRDARSALMAFLGSL